MPLLQIEAARLRVALLQRQLAGLKEKVAELRKRMGGIHAAQEHDLQVCMRRGSSSACQSANEPCTS